MSKSSESYRKSECCGGCDCDFLGENEDEPCWGQVTYTCVELGEDLYPAHVCQGHQTKYWDDKWDASDLDYRKEEA